MILDYLAVTLNNCVDFYSDYQIYLDNVVMQNRIEPDIFYLSQRQNKVFCMCDSNSAAITPASAYERVKASLKSY